MTLAIDIINGHGLSRKVYCEQESKGDAVLYIIFISLIVAVLKFDNEKQDGTLHL